MPTLSAQELVQDRIELVSLPDIALKLNELCDDTHSTAEDIADTIAMDAALTARLLKLVNSSFYAFPQKIGTITMAITVVGIAQLRDLAMATLVIERFKDIPKQLVDPDKFWSHNIACATAARTIVTELGIKQTERVFIAGLLHDIGKLLMYIAQPDLSAEVLQLVKNKPELEVNNLEEIAFGYNHAELGAALLAEWGLPDTLVEPVKYHHKPEQAVRFATESSVLCLANYVANQIEPLYDNEVVTFDEKVWTILNSSSEYLEDITTESQKLYDETVSIFVDEKSVA